MVIIYRRWHLPVSALAIVSTLLLLLSANHTLFAQEAPLLARGVSVIKTTELGLTHPTGLAFAPERNEFFVLEAPNSAGTSSFAIIDSYDDLVDLQNTEQSLNTSNVAYDRATQRLFLLNAAEDELLAVAWKGEGAPDLTKSVTYPLAPFGFEQPQGMAIDVTGQILYFLNTEDNEIVTLALSEANSVEYQRTIRLQLENKVTLQGLAIHPQTGHLFTLDTQNGLLYEFSTSGQLVESYEIEADLLRAPQSLVFAPSGDMTDDPEEMSLFIADSNTPIHNTVTTEPVDQPFSLYLPLVTGGTGQPAISNQPTVGRIVEITLEPLVVPVFAASVTTSDLVQTIFTNQFPSPDPSGIAYIAPSAFANNTDRFLMVDGEVEEMAIFDDANAFEFTNTGQLLQTYNLQYDPADQTEKFTWEPTGADFNPLNGHYFITDDDKRAIHEIDPGPDKFFHTADDIRTTLIVRQAPYQLGQDAEGIAFGMVNGTTPTLFMADGENNHVLVIAAGPDGRFGLNPNTNTNDDIVTNFDTESLGILDPEGIEYNPDNGHIYIIGNPVNKVAELTFVGSSDYTGSVAVVQLIDISAANPDKPAGLAFGPSSQNPGITNLYIVDRGVDNDSDPDENDGRIYEFTLPIAGNQAPLIGAVPNQTISFPASATLAATVNDDGLPNPPALVTTTWSKISGPGTVTFTNASAVNTTVSFSQVGVYVLRLTAFDGEYSAVKDVTITVAPPNQPPIVNAGPDRPAFLTTGITLTGTITDDGLPNPPALVTTTWLKVSGPGTVTFTSANALQTKVSFSQVGVYVLRLTATDSIATANDDVTITVSAVNQAPTVNAGATQTISFPASATLAATVNDDGLPNPPALVTTTWSKVSGSGTVTFTNASAVNTTVSFSQVGVYVLRLTAFDGEYTTVGNVTITVTSPNQPPIVNAGPDRPAFLTTGITLTGTITDDGLPNPPALVTTTWSKISGPGTVTFTDANALQTKVSFSEIGVYILRLTATDSIATANDDVTITISAMNQAPTVNAGSDQSIAVNEVVTLTATVDDDGILTSPATLLWEKVSGPGTVTFSHTDQVSTTVTFSAVGVYSLQLTAFDGELSATDAVTITVIPANTPPLVDAGPDQAVLLGGSATLSGTVTDDGLPNPTGQVSLEWQQVSGPETALLADKTKAQTTASFPVAGIYVFRLTATDGQLSASDEISISVNTINQAPVINLVASRVVTLTQITDAIIMTSTVVDESKPGELTIAWSQISGGGIASFSNPQATTTTVRFSQEGEYGLQLSVSDGEHTTTKIIMVQVNVLVGGEAPTFRVFVPIIQR